MIPHRLVTGATNEAYRPDFVSTGTAAASVSVDITEWHATTAGIWLLKRDTLGTRMLLDILKSAAGDREVGMLSDIGSVAERIRRQPPELLVLGITATDQPWWPRIAADFRAYPACRTMVVTDQGRPYLWRRLLEKRGLSLADLNADSVSDLAAGFARFARGERYLTPGIVAAAGRIRHPRLSAILSGAEQDVLCMVGLGMDTREIAAVQGVSIDAVRKRRSRVGQQLDVRRTSAIQTLARDLGYATFTPEGRPLPGFAYLLDRRRKITSEYIEGFEAQLGGFGVRKAECGRRLSARDQVD